jgi:hypothetical protein
MEELLVKHGINVEYLPGENPGKPYKITIEGENFFAAESFGSADIDMAEFVGKREASNILRKKMNIVLKEETRWQQYLKRRNMKAGFSRDIKLRRYFWTSDKIDKKIDDLNAKKINLKTAFRKFLAKHIIQVGRGRTANLIGILFAGKNVSREEIIEMNKVIRRGVEKIADEKIVELIDKYAGKEKKEIAKQIIKDVAEMLGRKLANETVDAIVDKVSSAISIIGWITLAFTILDIADMINNGSLQKYISGMNSQSMMDMSNLMDTTLSEERRGYVDVESGGDLSSA